MSPVWEVQAPRPRDAQGQRCWALRESNPGPMDEEASQRRKIFNIYNDL